MADDELQLEPVNYIWACPNGHEIVLPTDDFTFLALSFTGLDGKPIVQKLKICPLCYGDWIDFHVAELKCMGRMDEA